MSTTTTGTTPDRAVAHGHPVLRAVGLGATSGVLATLVFLVVHAIAISDIWFSAPMVVVAGAGCGACLGWSHTVVFRRPSKGTWVTWNAVQTSLLLVLGVTSALVYSPRWSMAELMVDEPPLADLFAAALPLMVGFAAAGAVVLWAVFSRRIPALPSVVVTVTVLVLVLGHNAAIIGLVEIPAAGVRLLAEMFGLIVLVGVMFTLSGLVLRVASVARE